MELVTPTTENRLEQKVINTWTLTQEEREKSLTTNFKPIPKNLSTATDPLNNFTPFSSNMIAIITIFNNIILKIAISMH
ncbi:hypothetical protein [Maribacter sp.]|uniref:hypothetical protein n=1 Tax=Maribacter sp. TaxID=1897614 RepID=UPI003299FEA0